MASPNQTTSNYGEQKGDRKRARALATQQRRYAHAIREKQLSQSPSSQVDAAARWNLFYQTRPTLFKDRNLLRGSFPKLVGTEAASKPKRHVPPLQRTQNPGDGHLPHCDLSAQSLSVRLQAARRSGRDLVLLEAGCGGGNAVFPVLRANGRLFAFAFDFSKEAVAVTKGSPEYFFDRIHAFHADLTTPPTFLDVLKDANQESVNFVTAFWTLSALPPSVHQVAVGGLSSALEDGGYLFFRDYATGDMREQKFAERDRHVTEDKSRRLFLRGDGTYAYFFEKGELIHLFQSTGLFCESCAYEERIVENRKEGLVMRRRWIQATFRKPQKRL